MRMLFTAGLPETACGAGSTVAYTANVRARLPALLRDLGVRVLLDAPCGDFNWMSQTDLSGLDYIGADFDMLHCCEMLARDSSPPWYGPRTKRALLADICDSIPVEADMMLCRDFMQHLPYSRVAAVLSNFVDSGITWLLCTSHASAVNSDIDSDGGFRCLNLGLSPINLPPPRSVIDDGPDRVLGLWHRGDL